MKYVFFLYIMTISLSFLGQKDFDQMVKGVISKDVPVLTVESLNKSISNGKVVVLLDAREPKEFTVSHLENALNCGYKNFDADALTGVKKSAPVVVYCSVGYRSDQIAAKLIKLGYTNVHNLYGGIFDWVNTGYPVFNENGKTNQIHGYDKNWGKWLIAGEKVFK